MKPFESPEMHVNSNSAPFPDEPTAATGGDEGGSHYSLVLLLGRLKGETNFDSYLDL